MFDKCPNIFANQRTTAISSPVAKQVQDVSHALGRLGLLMFDGFVKGINERESREPTAGRGSRERA